MRQAFAKAYGKLEDKRVTAQEYVEKELSELVGGEFRAEQLREIVTVSRDKVDPDVLLPVWDSKGHISVKKGLSSVAMPSGREQLRLRVVVICNALVMLKMKRARRGDTDIDATCCYPLRALQRIPPARQLCASNG